MPEETQTPEAPQTLERPRGLALFLHSLVPTAMGGMIYLGLGTLIIGAHLLGLSLSGTAFPASFDENLLQGYANFIIQPLATVVNNEFFNSGLTIVLWGVVGWVVCALVATIASALNEWHNTEKDITVPQEGVVVRHPLQRTLITRVLWRAFMGIMIILYTAAMLPVVRYCLGNDVVAMHVDSFMTGLYISAFTVLVWSAVFHGYVVLFRLYTLRTRLMGEILY
jgi:hypothetical protein